MTRRTYWQELGGEHKDRSPDEALADSGLDFEAVLRKTGHVNGKGNWKVDPLHMHCVREDNDVALGVVGTRWRPVQHRDALEVVRSIDEQIDVSVDSVWSAHDGRKAHMVLKWGGAEEWAGEGVQPYLIWSNSHDGKSSVKLLATAVQLSCTNQLPSLSREAAGRGLSASVVHSPSSTKKLEVAAKTIMQVAGWIDAERDRARAIAEVSLTDAEVERFFAGVTKADNRHWLADEAIASMMTLWSDSETAQAPKTAWKALHAVTEHYDHVAEYRTPVSRERNLSIGPPARCKRRAAEMALALVV